MHLKNQRSVMVDAIYEDEIEKLSKAALMDIAWSFAVRCCGVEGMPRQAMEEFRRERDAVVAVRKSAKTTTVS